MDDSDKMVRQIGIFFVVMETLVILIILPLLFIPQEKAEKISQLLGWKECTCENQEK